jgi:hypothetical protein
MQLLPAASTPTFGGFLMPERMPIEAWLLAAFFGSCVGLGFAAGYVARRRTWGSWTIGVASAGVALLWSTIVITASRLTSAGPMRGTM